MRAVSVSLLSLLLLSACDRATPVVQGGTAGPSPIESAAADPFEACEPGSMRCESDAHASRCMDDGRTWTAAACGDDTLCLDGRCASLGGVARDRWLAMRGEGWIDGWSLSAPLPAARVAELRARPDEWLAPQTDLGWRKACAPGGYITVHADHDARSTGQPFRVLTGHLVSGVARRARLAVGSAGGVRVLVNGDEVLASSSTSRPFPDAIEASIALRAGRNDVVVLVEQTTADPTGLWIRVRDDARLPIADLRFAPAVARASCGLGDLVDLEDTREVVGGGFALRLTPRLRGLAPPVSGDLDVRVELRRGASGKPDRLTSTTLSTRAMEEGRAAIDVTVRPEKAGKLRVVVTFGSGEAAFTREIPLEHRGALHDRVASLVGALATAPFAALPEGSRDSFEHDVRTAARALAEGHPDTSWIAARTTGAEEIAQAIAAGRDPYATRTGVVFRAHRSILDGVLQPYAVYVPRSYRPGGQAMPLVLAMHGLNQPETIALRTVIGEAPEPTDDRGFASRHLPPFPDGRAFLVAPWAYGNAGPRPLGEADALAVLDAMKKAYKIDASRVSMTGYSLGGTTSFVVPLHYPDLFSAAAPLCGYPNLATYESVRGVPHTPWEDVLIAKRYIVNYAENGRSLPLFIVHGGQDGPGRSAVVADRYRELGYARTFDVQDDLGHDVWHHAYDEGKLLAWLRARRRPDAPPHVRLVTGEYRYDRAFWVRLVAMRDSRLAVGAGGAPVLADIDAAWKKGERVVAVTTKNVAAFALDLRPLDVPEGASVLVDGAAIPVPEGVRVLFFEDAGQGWARTEREPSRAGKKRPGVAGPLDDVLRHRQLIVYGTLDPSQTEANRLVADRLRSDDQWSAARFPIKADVDVIDAELVGRSLVLIGGPASNRVTAQLAAGLPVRFEPSAIVIGGARHEGDDVGVSFITQSPRDAAEYVVVHAGVTARGTLASRYLPQLAPDYLVYDGRITTERGALLLGGRAVLAGGFFDDDWR